MSSLSRLRTILMAMALSLCLSQIGLSETEPGTVAPNAPLLKALIFLGNRGDLKPDGITGSGVTFRGLALLDTPEFKTSVAGEIGKPLTKPELNAITHSVIEFYRKQNHPMVDAVIPAQNIESGVVQVVVTEYRVGEVRTEGNRWFSNKVISAPIKYHHGDTIDNVELINQLDAANSNPFRRVNLIYQPSVTPGYTDLVLKTEDRLPVRVFAGFNNSGTPITGRSRWDLGATWGNALWHDQSLSYQFSGSDNAFTHSSRLGASFLGNSLTWSMPIAGRDSLSLIGSYFRSIPNLGEDFGLVGKSYQASARYSHALHRTGNLVHNVEAGFDFKSTNNNLNFGGTSIMRNNAEIAQFTVGYSGNLMDRLGSSSISTSLFFSPGNITPNNNNAAFQPADGQSGRPLASAHYTYWRSDFNRLTKLPRSFVWSFRAVGQTSTANLLYTEQLAAGGPELLRGYDPNSILGDRGIVLSNELRLPVIRRRIGDYQTGQLQLLGFWDWTHLNSAIVVEDAVNHLNASSTGMGLRYGFRSNMTAKLDYGWQLQHLTGVSNRDKLLNLSLIVSY